MEFDPEWIPIQRDVSLAEAAVLIIIKCGA
jgi:hypothetical protein